SRPHACWKTGGGTLSTPPRLPARRLPFGRSSAGPSSAHFAPTQGRSGRAPDCPGEALEPPSRLPRQIPATRQPSTGRVKQSCRSYSQRLRVLRHEVVRYPRRWAHATFPMPIQCELDDANERVRITSTGDVSVDEVLEAVNWQAEHGAWSYGVLYDARDTISGPRAEDLFRLVTRVGALTAAHGPPGPVAFVLTAHPPPRPAGRQVSGPR